MWISATTTRIRSPYATNFSSEQFFSSSISDRKFSSNHRHQTCSVYTEVWTKKFNENKVIFCCWIKLIFCLFTHTHIIKPHITYNAITAHITYIIPTFCHCHNTYTELIRVRVNLLRMMADTNKFANLSIVLFFSCVDNIYQQTM